jgi:hypothetical protein
MADKREKREAREAREAGETQPEQPAPAARTFDVVSFIISYEAGELDSDEVIDGFQHLIDMGIVWQLQGSYQRAAMSLLESDLCTIPGVAVRKRAN